MAALAVVLWVASATGQETSPANGASRMVARLESIAQASVATNPYAGSMRAAALAAIAAPSEPQDLLRYLSEIARFLLYAGQSTDAAVALEDILTRATEEPSVSPTFVSAVRQLLALSYLRLATQQNCVAPLATARCSVPIGSADSFPNEDAARRAIEEYTRILGNSPDASTTLTSQWLLNLSYMTLGEYPLQVPLKWLIPPEAFRSEYDIGRFPDVASTLGLDIAGRKGGGVIDDFDSDGDLDVMASSDGLFAVANGENPIQLRYFRNEGDGTFSDRTTDAGLDGLVSGLNIVQADYDNDGFLDLLVLRGAWLNAAHPNSLLRNNGDGTFSDVTEQSGLLIFAPTQTAAWGDYDNDGWVDLFVGNETIGATVYPSNLFRNNGDGTFTDVAAGAGVAVVGFVKGVVWADYDNDGGLDLFVTRLRDDQPNLLFHNDGPNDQGEWSFRDVAAEAGVEGPPVSFPTWFFDYDNDGWTDLFVSGFSGGLGDVVLERLGQPHGGQLPRLYRNAGDGTFSDVTHETGLDRIMVGMGSNFGDLDNDGFLDMYLGTGDPDYRMLVPNLMFRNAEGARFQDVTTTGGFGHLQKGHGVAFGDIDADGDQDLYHVVGGAYEGDTFPNALYLNPGHGSRWITLRLQGVTTNRGAIGARIKVSVITSTGDREVHVTVGSGGSFGGSSLQQEIGLGEATEIRRLEVTWPTTGLTNIYTDIELDQMYLVLEGADSVTRIDQHPLVLLPPGVELDTVEGAAPPVALARDASMVGDWDSAIIYFQQALAQTPADPLLNLQLGMALSQSGDTTAALGYLGEAVRLDSEFGLAHLRIGTLLERGDRPEDAIPYYRFAASLDATADEAAFRLAQALRRAGRFEASLSYYDQAIERSDARFGRAMALVQLQRHAEARDQLQAGMDRHPWESAFTLAMARLLAASPSEQVRDGSRALELVQALAEQLRTTAVAETLAMAHAELGQFAQAVEWQRLAMSVATEAGQLVAAQGMSANLALFLSGQPSRTPWRADELQ